MRIIEIIPTLQVGGAERFVVDISNTFANKGNEVILVTLFDKTPEHVFENDLLDVKRVELHKRKGLDIKCLLRVLNCIKHEKPEIVHSHGEATKYLFLSALFYRKCHYYATIHSDAKFDSGNGFNFLIRSFLYKLNLVSPVTISIASRNSFSRLFGIYAPLIENGCKAYVRTCQPMPDYRIGVDYLFIHVASIQQVKNQVVLIEAFERILVSGVKARLLFLGRPHDISIFETLKGHWSESIVYLGERANTRDYMCQADAFCLTSTVEGMPMTVIEALSVGCPTITTPAGGCVNIVKDGFNGFLSDSFTVSSYVGALERFISLSDKERRVIKSNAKKSFDDLYDISITANRYLSLFGS